MLIAAEGPDGAGKTTLVARLRAQLGEEQVEVRRRGPLERDPLDEYAVDIQDYRPGTGRHVLCDRWHWGEDVYGPLLRGGSQLTREVRVHVENVLLARGGVVVHVTGDPERVAAQLESRGGDDLVSREDVPDLVKRYEVVAAGSRVPSVEVRVGDDPGWTTARVLEFARRHERRTASLRRHPTYTGPRWPRFLLLGEKRHGDPPYRHEAAFTPASATSGRFLLRALDDGILDAAGFANAREGSVRDLWNELGRPRICALGRVAADTCRFQGVPHGAAPHPQFVRRFHHAALREYGSLIREVLTRHQEDRLGWRPS